MENFGKFMTVVLITITTSIINGFVFVKLWYWFIVPTFSMEELRIVEAIGVILLIGFVKQTRDKENKDDDFWSKFLESMIYIVVFALLALGFGYLISLFM